MKLILKVFLWVIILGLLGYGAWYAYNNWWGTGDAGKFVETTSKNIGDAAKFKANEIKTDIASGTVSRAKTFLGDTLGKLLSGAGEAIQNAGAGLRGTNPVPANGAAPTAPLFESGPVPQPTSTSFYIPPPPATIMTKVAAPLSFSINSGSSYKVDWGDGTATERATITGSEITVVNHTWNKEGDYTVQMTIGNANPTQTFSFPVRVYR